MWNHHLNNELQQVSFKQSAVDECVWYKDGTVLFYYVDNRIFMGPESKAINRAIKDI